MTQDQLLIKEIIDSSSSRAYRTLVEKYQNKVLTVCVKVLRNREEAEETAQDVFIKGFKLLNTLNDHTKFPNWILKIAYSKAIDRQRLKKMNTTDLNQVNESAYKQLETPFVLTSLEDRKEILTKLIEELDVQESVVISLFYQQERNIKEISEITGMTPSNVKVKLYRARKSLRLMLNRKFKNEANDLL